MYMIIGSFDMNKIRIKDITYSYMLFDAKNLNFFLNNSFTF